MRRATGRRVRLLLWFLLAGTVIGAAYGGLLGRMFRGTGLIGALIGAIDGAVITIPIATMEVFLFRTRWGRAVQQAPFLVTFGVKWLVYGMLITAVNLRSPGVLVLGLMFFTGPIPMSVAFLAVLFSFTVAFAILLVFQVGADRGCAHSRPYRARPLPPATRRGKGFPVR